MVRAAVSDVNARGIAEAERAVGVVGPGSDAPARVILPLAAVSQSPTTPMIAVVLGSGGSSFGRRFPHQPQKSEAKGDDGQNGPTSSLLRPTAGHCVRP